MSSFNELRNDLLKKYNVSAAGNTGSTTQSSGSGTTQQSGSDFYTIRSTLLDKYSSDKTQERKSSVSSWADRYNSLMDSISGKSSAVKGVEEFQRDIDELIRDFADIEDYADKLGMPNAQRYLKQLQDSQKFYGQFSSQKEYDDYLTYQKDLEAKRNLDLDEYEAGILELQKQYDRYKNAKQGSIRAAEGKTGQETLMDLLKQTGDEIDRRKQYLTLAKRIQEQAAGDEKYSQVTRNADFAQKSGYDKGNQDIGYQYMNADAAGKLDLEQKHGQYARQWADRGFDSLSEEEKAVYNYYMNTGDREEAARYLKYLEENLQIRKGTETDAYVDKLVEDDPRAKALRYAFMANVGLDQNRSGMEDLGHMIAGNTEYRPASATQYAGQLMREDLGNDGKKHEKLGGVSTGQMVGDIISTTANMAPSILTSSVLSLLNPGLGATTGKLMMSGSAAGSGYREMINEGYSKEQAQLYGLGVGAAEYFMESALGGISKLGGVPAKALTKWVENVDNALLKFALQLGGSGISEGMEEGLTDVVTGWLKSQITHEDFYAEPADVLYSSLLGMATGVLFEGPDAAVKSFGKKATDIPRNATELAKADRKATADNGAAVTENPSAAVAENATTEKSLAVGDKMKATEKVGVSKMETVQMTEDIDSFAKQYGKQAEAVKQNYLEGQDLKEYEVGFQAAFAIGKEGGSKEGLQQVPYLSQAQKDIAFSMGQYAAAEERREAEKAKTQKMPKATLTNEDGESSPVSIAEVVSMDDNAMTFRLSDGSTVTDEALTFDKGDQVLSAVWESGMDVKAANAILADMETNPATDADQAAGIDEAYRYGSHGYSMEQLVKNGADAAALTENQRKAAYDAGVNARQAAAVAAPAVKTEKGTTSTGVYLDSGSGNVTAFSQKDLDGLSSKRKAGVQAAMALQKIGVGGNFVFYESYVNDAGERVYKDANGVEKIAPNGWYDPKDDSIHIDLNAGGDASGLTLYTLSHELTHFVEKRSKEKYQALADFLADSYGKHGQSVDALVIAKQKELSESRGEAVTYDEAYSEFIADSMEAMLSDVNVLEKLADLKAKDRGLFDEIRKFFDNLVKKIREVYAQLVPDSEEGRAVLQMKDQIEQIQQLFAEALADASENYQAAEAVGFDVDAETESVAPAIQYSERTWKESDYVKERNKAAAEIATAIGVTEKKARDYIDSINSIAKMIAEDRTRLDYFSSPYRSSFVSNVEYGGSFDFSTLCKKRRLLTGTFTAIQKALPNTALTANEILDIRNRMKDAGLEVSCGLCYVEGSRANMGQFAKEFLRLYREYYPDAWQPNMADVNTPDGIEWVRINHPECYEQYEYFWNHYGTLKPGDKNLFASQQKPKLYQLHTEYQGEILQKFKNDDNVEEKNRNGGIRLQSFSDFEIVHLIDTMQIIMDMSRVGLAGQAYTKVPDFAWALGDTGLKINLSLIAKGVDENGKLIFDDIEGMPIAEAMRLRDRYSANVGTILVAFNDEQLMAAMADDRVDFIIPFHRSQWKKSQYEAMGLPAKTKDYTYMQNEKFIKPQYHEYRGRMVKDKATNYMPNEYWDFSKSGKENAEAYLEMCARNNKRPKFYKLLQNNWDGSYSLKADGSTDGYWKLLIDFKMYDNDGNGSPQMPVRPEFNMEESTRMLNEYRGGHSSFPVAQGIVDEFVQEYKDSHEGIKYSVRKTIPTTDTDGNQLSKEQQEYFAESKARDENGKLLVLYHGTTKAGFTVPDPQKYSHDKTSFFLTSNPVTAKNYSGTDEVYAPDGSTPSTSGSKNYKVYANLKNPLIVDAERSGWNTIKPAESKFEYVKLLKYRDAKKSMFGSPFFIKLEVKERGQDAKVVTFEDYNKYIDYIGNGHYKIVPRGDNVTVGKTYYDVGGQNNWNTLKYAKYAKEHGYDGVIFKNLFVAGTFFDPKKDQKTYDTVAVVFDGNQVKSVNNTNPTESKDIRYSERITGTSNRALLAGALDQLAQKPDEREFLQKYRENASELDKQEARLQELRRQIRDISFGKGPRDMQKLKQLQEEAAKTANRIDIYDKRLLGLEATVPLKRVLEREKAKVKQKADADKKAAMEKFREETKAAYEGVQSNAEIMEREFLRLMRAYEKQSADTAAKAKKTQKAMDKKQATIDSYKEDLKTMEREFLRVMKGYETAERKNNAFWEGEFKRLMREYEASGRKADRLEAKVKAQREAARANVDSRRRTVLRNKIRKDIRELQKILDKGNKKRNVKQGMQDFVSKTIATGEILFADLASDTDLIASGIQADMTTEERKLLTEAESYVRRIEELEGNEDMADVLKARKEGYAEVLKQLKPVLERERIRINSTEASKAFDSLVEAYRSLKESADSYIAMAFNPEVLEYLEGIKHKFAGTLVRDMSQEQLQTLHDCYKMVMTTIRDVNKAFVDGRSVQADAEQLVQEFQERKVPVKKMGVVLKNLSDAAGWNYEKLYYALERINSPTLKRLFGNLANSENITMRDVQEAKEFQKEMVEKYHYNDWDVSKKMEQTFLDSNGKEFHLTLGELMALYAYSRREGADRHIEVGGFTFGKTALTDPNPAATYKLTADQVAAISGLLTPEQKSFAEAMQRYLSKTMGAKGNEVSMKLYGIEMFNEENYFPLHVAGEYKAKAQESQAKANAGFQSMSNAGFTKARNTNATAPIVLEDFMSVWADHVNEMSRYHGAVPALEDIRRVMNYSVYSDAMAESVSVTAAMTNAYGKQAVKYFDDLYREANSGAVTDRMDAASKKMLSLFRKNSVAYSASVVIQQPTSIFLAKAMIDGKYFGAHGMFTLTGGVLRILNRKKWNTAYADMMKYAPGVAMAKEIGGFDTSTGSSIRSYLLDTDRSLKQSMKHGTVKEKAGALMGLVDDNFIANLPNVADKLAWIEIWEACRRETAARNPKMETSSEAFKQKVGDRFTEVIRATQVYDSMFSKSPMLKSRNLAVQYVVSFMNEPNTVANMAEQAIRDIVDKDFRKAGKAVGALATSIVATNLLKSIIYAMRDDEEDETFREKYLSAVAGNLMGDANLLNYIPIARDIWSIWEGYDVERSDMAIVADAVSAIQKLRKLNKEDISKMTEEELEAWDKKVMDAQWRLAETLAPVVGIPLKNIRREILAVINAVNIRELDKGRTSTELSIRHAIEEATGKAERSDRDKLYEALAAGDQDYVKRLRAGYDDDAAYHNAIRMALRDHDSRVWEAAIAWNSNDLQKYMDIAKEIIGEGNFIQDDVVLAIRAEASSMEESGETAAAQKKGYFSNDKFGVAMGQNNTAMADIIQKDLIETKMANGKTREEAQKSVQSTARSQLKELYELGEITGAVAQTMLVRYGGYDREDAKDKVAEWKYEADYPELEGRITYSQYKRWVADGKSRGVSIETYTKVSEYRGGDTSEGVRSQKEVAEYINSLPISPEKKDALWLCFWSEKTLYDNAPWHN